MKTNRYETSPFRTAKAREFLGVSPAWWGMTLAATFAFIWAIAWLLTSPAPAI